MLDGRFDKRLGSGDAGATLAGTGETGPAPVLGQAPLGRRSDRQALCATLTRTVTRDTYATAEVCVGTRTTELYLLVLLRMRTSWMTDDFEHSTTSGAHLHAQVESIYV
jgi:hypothetical protein